MNRAYRKSFYIYPGSDFLEEVILSDIYVDISDLTNYTGTGLMELSTDSTVTQVINVEVVVGEDKLILTVDDTATDDLDSGTYNFNIQLVVDTFIITVLTGTIIVD